MNPHFPKPVLTLPALQPECVRGPVVTPPPTVMRRHVSTVLLGLPNNVTNVLGTKNTDGKSGARYPS